VYGYVPVHEYRYSHFSSRRHAAAPPGHEGSRFGDGGWARATSVGGSRRRSSGGPPPRNPEPYNGVIDMVTDPDERDWIRGHLAARWFLRVEDHTRIAIDTRDTDGGNYPIGQWSPVKEGSIPPHGVRKLVMLGMV
jgi:hypothetical protein